MRIRSARGTPQARLALGLGKTLAGAGGKGLLSAAALRSLLFVVFGSLLLLQAARLTAPLLKRHGRVSLPSEERLEAPYEEQPDVRCDMVSKLGMCEVRDVCMRVERVPPPRYKWRLLVENFRIDWAFAEKQVGRRTVSRPVCRTTTDGPRCEVIKGHVEYYNRFFQFSETSLNNTQDSHWVSGNTIIGPAVDHAMANYFHQMEGIAPAAEAVLVQGKRAISYQRVLFAQPRFFGGVDPNETVDGRDGIGFEVADAMMGKRSRFNMDVELLPKFLREHGGQEGKPVCFERVLFVLKGSELPFNTFKQACFKDPNKELDTVDCPLAVGLPTLQLKNDVRKLMDPELMTGEFDMSKDSDSLTALTGPAPPKTAAFLFRDSHRYLANRAEAIVMLRAICEEYGFQFSYVRNNGTFTEQVQRMSKLGLVVSVHGANLVNTMYMPVASALIEIMPGKMNPGGMLGYWRGCNSGLHFDRLKSINVTDHPMVGPGKRYNNSYDCVAHEPGCRDLYHDQNLTVDLEELRRATIKAIKQITSFSKGFRLALPAVDAGARTEWGWRSGFLVVPVQ